MARIMLHFILALWQDPLLPDHEAQKFTDDSDHNVRVA